jgi:chromate reductase
VPMMPQPEAYIGGASKLFDEQGQLSNEDTRKFVEKFVQAFAEWIERNAKR